MVVAVAWCLTLFLSDGPPAGFLAPSVAPARGYDELQRGDRESHMALIKTSQLQWSNQSLAKLSGKTAQDWFNWKKEIVYGE